jgi:DNA-binding response OmpR family regulator
MGSTETEGSAQSALVVDDERNVRLFLRGVLNRSGFEVADADSGEAALEILQDTSFDLIVLDLNLGGRVDGMRVFRSARWRWPDAAIVILTAHGSLGSAVEAIREGIDGYLLKPVSSADLRSAVREALERRRAISRASGEGALSDLLRHGPFVVDEDKHLALKDEERLDLTAQEFKLLVCLLENADRVVSPKELVRAVRGFEPDSTYEARQIIKWYIHQLRRKVEDDPSDPKHVLNVRGVGYTFGPRELSV